jgi:hypothetical protein
LATDSSVEAVERHRWGREGEVSLCIRVASAGDAERLSAVIGAVFPAEPRGPLEVSTFSGVSISVPQRAEYPH